MSFKLSARYVAYAVITVSCSVLQEVRATADLTCEHPIFSIQRFTVPSQPWMVDAGVLTDGGLPSIVALSQTDESVAVVLNSGGGRFESYVRYPVGSSPNALALVDVDGRNELDVVVVNGEDDDLMVLLNDGHGAFTEAQRLPTGRYPRAVATGDLTGNSMPDLVAVNGLDDSISVFLNLGDGTFAPQAMYPVGAGPGDVAIGDFNGDGHLDLMVSNSALAARTVSVLYNNGDGTFTPAVQFHAGNSPRAIVVADLNGDGHLDAVVANWLFDETMTVLVNDGAGSFTIHDQVHVSPQPMRLKLVDITGNGKLALAVLYENQDDIHFFQNDGDAQFSPLATYAVLRPRSLAFADFENNGAADMVISSFYVHNWLLLARSEADGFFAEQASSSASPAGSRMAVGDLNANGVLDAIVSRFRVYHNDGSGSLKYAMQYLSPAGSENAVAVADLNNNGALDALSAGGSNSSSARLYTFFNRGDGMFDEGAQLNVPSLAASLAVGDVTGNGSADIVVTGRHWPNAVSILRNNGAGHFDITSTNELANAPVAVSLGDLNNDGHLDKVVGYYFAGNPVAVWLNGGRGEFKETFSLGPAGVVDSVVLHDFNADGRLDILSTSGSTIRVYQNNGQDPFSMFSLEKTISSCSDVSSLQVGDMNRDGFDDLIAGCNGSIAIHLADGLSGFGQRVHYGSPANAILGDVNGNGQLDLITPIAREGRLITLKNRCPEHMSCLGDANDDGQVNVTDVLLILAAWGDCSDSCTADFNRDGVVNAWDLLIVLAQWGQCE